VERRNVQVARESQRSRFDRIAEAVSQFVSRGAFFTVSLVAVLIWTPTILLRRYDEALHDKIDALAAGLADLMEQQTDPDPERLARHIDELRAAVRLEERL
jgi:uncharacterized membrane protein